MIIRLSTGQCELLEKDDFKTLKLRAPDGWQADEIQRELPFKATFGPGHVWVQGSGLEDALSERTTGGAGINPDV